MTHLRIECDGSAPVEVDLAPGDYTLGADDDNTLVIDHPSVSRHHCALRVRPDGRVEVRDLDSTNGTCIDGQPLHQGVLDAGQSFQAGTARVTLSRRPPVKLPPPLPTRPPSGPPANPPAQAPLKPCSTGTSPGFFPQIPGAFGYPFKGEAYLYIVIVVALGNVQLLLPGPFGLLALFMELVISCYLMLLWQQVVLSTIDGEDQFPIFPHLTLDWRAQFSVFQRYVALVLVCFGPAIVCGGIPGASGWPRQVCFGLGCLYFPMAFLAFIITDSFAVLSPVFILRSVTRTLPGYLVLAVSLALIVGATPLLTPPTTPANPGLFSSHRMVLLTELAIGSAVDLYLLFVWMRLLGLFYREHRDALAWA